MKLLACRRLLCRVVGHRWNITRPELEPVWDSNMVFRLELRFTCVRCGHKTRTAFLKQTRDVMP